MLASKGRGAQSLPPIISRRRLAVSPSCGVPGRSISLRRDAIVLLRSLMGASEIGGDDGDEAATSPVTVESFTLSYVTLNLSLVSLPPAKSPLVCCGIAVTDDSGLRPIYHVSYRLGRATYG